MITIAATFWEPNAHSFSFSRMYDESWVEKLYRGFRRNLTGEMEFVCFVDRLRQFREPIRQVYIETRPITYRACIEPYKIKGPMIIAGLDTIVLGNIDHLADYCRAKDRLAVPRDPSNPHTVCNGVALVPPGYEKLWEGFVGEDDMEHIRAQNPAVIDDIWPGEVVSYKGHAEKEGIDGVKIVYFHGERKPHEIRDDWVREHWI